MSIKPMIATKKVFDQSGVLRFPGETVMFDTNPKKTKGIVEEERDKGLADPKDVAKIARTATVVAAIAPTGPNPTMPQQLPAGSMQTRSGHRGPEGEQLVAEGSEAALEIEEGGEPAVRKPASRKSAEKVDAEKDELLS